jgi:hypothetical protein
MIRRIEEPVPAPADNRPSSAALRPAAEKLTPALPHDCCRPPSDGPPLLPHILGFLLRKLKIRMCGMVSEGHVLSAQCYPRECSEVAAGQKLPISVWTVLLQVQE